MKSSVVFLSRFLLAGLVLVLTGCPFGRNASDEEKEPHFLAGKARVNAMDFRGAIESFQKALEVNPRSAAAHFELGWLYERKDADPAAAIYHYEQYLKLRRNAGNAELVQQRVLACKQELARTVSLGPLTPRQQRDLEKMAEENKKLMEENKRLADELARWQAFYAARMQTPTNTPSVGTDRQSGATTIRRSGAATTTTASASPASTATPPARSGRTHVIRSGDTLAALARQYRVSLQAISNANPGINPRRLQVGQTVNIP